MTDMDLKKRPLGLKIFVFVIVISSLFQIQRLYFDAQIYKSSFVQVMPAEVVEIRYLFSWALRIAGIIVAIGIYSFHELSRRLGILIGVFTICTLYWKHPYKAFLYHAQCFDKLLQPYFRSSGLGAISLAEVTWPAIILNSILDALFWGLFIYYFTRPRIKKLF